MRRSHRGYGRFDGVPSRPDLERFFFLDDADRNLIGDRRGDHNRLGLMLQATAVRYVGRFLEDPSDVPWPVVEYVAEQLGIADTSCVKRYTDRAMTAYEHCRHGAKVCGPRYRTGIHQHTPTAVDPLRAPPGRAGRSPWRPQ